MSKPARQRKALPVNIYSNTGNTSLDETLLQPYIHIAKHLDRGATRMISTAFSGWYKIPAEKLEAIEEIIRIFYNSAYLCDDIEDGSILRRGKPAAHNLYGGPNTLAALNYSFMISFEKLLDFIDAAIPQNRDEIIREVIEVILDECRGQGNELNWRKNFICPTEEEYLQVCKWKSQGLFKISVILMSACSTTNETYSKVLELVGWGFQLLNDYQNLTSEVCHGRKTFCEDITEGKFSYPIIHAINSRPEDNRIMEILRLRTTDYKLKRHCLDLIKECGSLEYTKNKIAEIREEIEKEMKRYGPNPQMDTLIAFSLGKKE